MRLPKPLKADLDMLLKEKGCLNASDVEMTFKAHGVNDIPVEILSAVWGGLTRNTKDGSSKS